MRLPQRGGLGAFYPPGMKPHDFLSYYAKQFKTVEIDSTYYGTPSASTVTNWYERTPPDFVFAAKVPQVVTHEKVLVDCRARAAGIMFYPHLNFVPSFEIFRRLWPEW